MTKTGDDYYSRGLKIFRPYRDKLSKIADDLKVLKISLQQPKLVEEISAKIGKDFREARNLVTKEDVTEYNKKMDVVQEDTKKLAELISCEVRSESQIKTEVMMLWNRYQTSLASYRSACQEMDCPSNLIIAMQLYVLTLFENFSTLVPEISETIEDQKRRILEF